MANGTPGWLVAVPCRRPEALHDAARCGLRLRDLSMRDKREVASLAAAGLVSALCVMVIGNEVQRSPLLDARELSFAVAVAPQGPTSFPLATPRRRGSPRTSPRPLLASADLREHTAAPASSRYAAEPIAASPTARSVRPVLLVADGDMAPSSNRKAPGPLKRILFGSGQYRVQPFPVVSVQ